MGRVPVEQAIWVLHVSEISDQPSKMAYKKIREWGIITKPDGHRKVEEAIEYAQEVEMVVGEEGGNSYKLSNRNGQTILVRLTISV